MTAAHTPPLPARDAPLRAWLEYVVETALDWLDALDAADEDLEDDETEVVVTVEDGVR